MNKNNNPNIPTKLFVLYCLSRVFCVCIGNNIGSMLLKGNEYGFNVLLSKYFCRSGISVTFLYGS